MAVKELIEELIEEQKITEKELVELGWNFLGNYADLKVFTLKNEKGKVHRTLYWDPKKEKVYRNFR